MLSKQQDFQEKRCCQLTLQNSCLDDFWVMFSQIVTKICLSLGDAPDKVSENALIVIEMFVVLIYDMT